MNCVQAAIQEADKLIHQGNGYHLKLMTVDAVDILINVIAATDKHVHCFLVDPENNTNQEEVFINTDRIFMVKIEW